MRPPPILHSYFDFKRITRSTSVLVDFSVEPHRFSTTVRPPKHSLRPQPRHPSNPRSCPSAFFDPFEFSSTFSTSAPAVLLALRVRLLAPPCFLWHSEDSRCPLLAALDDTSVWDTAFSCTQCFHLCRYSRRKPSPPRAPQWDARSHHSCAWNLSKDSHLDQEAPLVQRLLHPREPQLLEHL